jgi:hypothetical protein
MSEVVKALVIHPHNGHYAGDTVEMSKEAYDRHMLESVFPYYHVLNPEVLKKDEAPVEFIKDADLETLEVTEPVAEKKVKKGKQAPVEAE